MNKFALKTSSVACALLMSFSVAMPAMAASSKSQSKPNVVTSASQSKPKKK